MAANERRNTRRSMLLAAGVGMTLLATAGSVLVSAQGPGDKRPVMRFLATTDNVKGAGDAARIEILTWATDAQRDEMMAAWNLTPAPGGGARGAGGRGAAAPRGGAAPARGGAPAPGGAPAAAPGGAPARGAAPAPGAPPAAAAPAQAPPDAAGAAAAGAVGAGRGGARGAVPARGGAAAGAAAGPVETPESSLTAWLQTAQTAGYLWTSESTGYSIRFAYRVPLADGGERVVLLTDRRLGSWNDVWKPAGATAPNAYEFSLIELRLNGRGEGEGKASLTGKVAVDAAANVLALDGYAELPVVLKGVKRQPAS